jgi:hypothetical protein
MTFGPAETYAFDDAEPWWVETVDVDSDGDLDVAAWTRGIDPDGGPVSRSIQLLINTGDGTLAKATSVVLEALPLLFAGTVASGDLDGDGDADLLATSGTMDAPGHLWRLANDGTGRFDIAQKIDVGMHPSAIVARDFDHDGVAEVALMFSHNSGLDPSKREEPYLLIFENDGTGELTIDQEFIDPNFEGHWVMHAADVNADGDDDLVIPDPSNGVVHVLLNHGDATFGEVVAYDGVSYYAFGAAIADFDADGRTDIAITGGHYVRTLFNRACPPCAADVNADGALNILDFVAFQLAFLSGEQAADCDGDGRLSNPLDFICFQLQFLAGCP